MTIMKIKTIMIQVSRLNLSQLICQSNKIQFILAKKVKMKKICLMMMMTMTIKTIMFQVGCLYLSQLSCQSTYNLDNFSEDSQDEESSNYDDNDNQNYYDPGKEVCQYRS